MYGRSACIVSCSGGMVINIECESCIYNIRVSQTMTYLDRVDPHSHRVDMGSTMVVGRYAPFSAPELVGANVL